MAEPSYYGSIFPRPTLHDCHIEIVVGVRSQTHQIDRKALIRRANLQSRDGAGAAPRKAAKVSPSSVSSKVPKQRPCETTMVRRETLRGRCGMHDATIDQAPEAALVDQRPRQRAPVKWRLKLRKRRPQKPNSHSPAGEDGRMPTGISVASIAKAQLPPFLGGDVACTGHHACASSRRHR